jgi:hypothetical protein
LTPLYYASEDIDNDRDCNDIILRTTDFKMIYKFDADKSAVKVVPGLCLAPSNYLIEVNDIMIGINLDSRLFYDTLKNLS